MRWTTARPTVSGWYWIRQPREDVQIVQVVGTTVYEAGFEEAAPLESYPLAEWAGPLIPPGTLPSEAQ